MEGTALKSLDAQITLLMPDFKRTTMRRILEWSIGGQVTVSGHREVAEVMSCLQSLGSSAQLSVEPVEDDIDNSCGKVSAAVETVDLASDGDVECAQDTRADLVLPVDANNDSFEGNESAKDPEIDPILADNANDDGSNGSVQVTSTDLVLAVDANDDYGDRGNENAKDTGADVLAADAANQDSDLNPAAVADNDSDDFDSGGGEVTSEEELVNNVLGDYIAKNEDDLSNQDNDLNQDKVGLNKHKSVLNSHKDNLNKQADNLNNDKEYPINHTENLDNYEGDTSSHKDDPTNQVQDGFANNEDITNSDNSDGLDDGLVPTTEMSKELTSSSPEDQDQSGLPLENSRVSQSSTLGQKFTDDRQETSSSMRNHEEKNQKAKRSSLKGRQMHCMFCTKKGSFGTFKQLMTHLSTAHYRKEIMNCYGEDMTCPVCSKQMWKVARNFSTNIVHLGVKHKYVMSLASKEVREQLKKLESGCSQAGLTKRPNSRAHYDGATPGDNFNVEEVANEDEINNVGSGEANNEVDVTGNVLMDDINHYEDDLYTSEEDLTNDQEEFVNQRVTLNKHNDDLNKHQDGLTTTSQASHISTFGNNFVNTDNDIIIANNDNGLTVDCTLTPITQKSRDLASSPLVDQHQSVLSLSNSTVSPSSSSTAKESKNNKKVTKSNTTNQGQKQRSLKEKPSKRTVIKVRELQCLICFKKSFGTVTQLLTHLTLVHYRKEVRAQYGEDMSCPACLKQMSKDPKNNTYIVQHLGVSHKYVLRVANDKVREQLSQLGNSTQLKNCKPRQAKPTKTKSVIQVGSWDHCRAHFLSRKQGEWSCCHGFIESPQELRLHLARVHYADDLMALYGSAGSPCSKCGSHTVDDRRSIVLHMASAHPSSVYALMPEVEANLLKYCFPTKKTKQPKNKAETEQRTKGKKTKKDKASNDKDPKSLLKCPLCPSRARDSYRIKSHLSISHYYNELLVAAGVVTDDSDALDECPVCKTRLAARANKKDSIKFLARHLGTVHGYLIKVFLTVWQSS